MLKEAPLFLWILISAGEVGAQARGRLAGQIVAQETGEGRRTFLHLSRKPREAPEVARLEVVSNFREVLPSIPLIANVWSTLEIEPKAKRPYDEEFEFHRLLEVRFVGAIPGRPAPPRDP